MTSSIIHLLDNNEEKNHNYDVNSRVKNTGHDTTDDAPLPNRDCNQTPPPKKEIKGVEDDHNNDDDDDESHKVKLLQTYLEHQHPTSIATLIQPDYWPPRNRLMKNYYDWSLPTHEVYKYYDHHHHHHKNGDDHDGSDEKEEMGDNNRNHHHAAETAAIIQTMCQTNYLNDTINTKQNKNDIDIDTKEDDIDKNEPSSSSSKMMLFTPTFCEARSKLDYTYHTHVVKQRQYLQDAIIQRIVSNNNIMTTNYHHYPFLNPPKNSTKDTTTTTENDDDDDDDGMNNIKDTTPPTTTTITSTTNATNIIDTNKDHVVSIPSSSSHRPWIVFTAGPMGVGKGYVITQLQQLQLFNVRDHFITIDPDLIKYEIPEMVGYLQMDRSTAATKVHRESTQISDIIFEYAILHSLSILVDGSLRDVNYYQSLFHRIRIEFPQYRIGIIHITATNDVIYERAASRAIRTGRVIPKKLLEESIEQVPKSVELLSPLADAVHVIANHPDQPIQLLSSTIRRKKRLQNFICTDKNHISHTNKEEEEEVVTTTSWKEFKESWDFPSMATGTFTSSAQANLKGKDSEVANIPPLSNSLTSKINDLPKDIGNTSTTTSVISDMKSPSILETLPNNNSYKKKSLHSSISMSQFYDDHPTQVIANAIWQKSYPNFCARCALVTDEQCGICIHNVHICACSICSDHPTCSSQSG